MNKLNLVWNVYRYNINSDSMEVFNVFNHLGFIEDIERLINTKTTYDDFSAKLKSCAMYYFWSKCEYEIVITSFPPYVDRKGIDRLRDCNCRFRESVELECGEKVDVYNQLKINWSHFVDYMWQFVKYKE